MFWKVLFYLYLIYVMFLTSAQSSEVAQSDVPVWLYEVFGITFLIFGIVLALVYLYALGWQKRVISPLYNKYLLWGGIAMTCAFATFFCIQGNGYLHNDMLIYAMREGMVPRNPDFQALLWITRFEILGYAILRIFLIFAPFFFGYYFYTKRMNNFAPLKFAGRKIFSVFMFLNGVPVILTILLAFLQNFVAYNVFDIISLLCSCYLLAGVFGYAFNKKLFEQSFWRITLPVFAIASFIPSSFNSGSFQKLTQMPTIQQEPILFITEVIILVGALYLIYKYAFTDEVFEKKEVTT